MRAARSTVCAASSRQQREAVKIVAPPMTGSQSSFFAAPMRAAERSCRGCRPGRRKKVGTGSRHVLLYFFHSLRSADRAFLHAMYESSPPRPILPLRQMFELKPPGVSNFLPSLRIAHPHTTGPGSYRDSTAIWFGQPGAVGSVSAPEGSSIGSQIQPEGRLTIKARMTSPFEGAGLYNL